MPGFFLELLAAFLTLPCCFFASGFLSLLRPSNLKIVKCSGLLRIPLVLVI